MLLEHGLRIGRFDKIKNRLLYGFYYPYPVLLNFESNTF